jgi:mannose-1-phosphate guanylyltransferase/mannose-6-phosphate isomerase
MLLSWMIIFLIVVIIPTILSKEIRSCPSSLEVGERPWGTYKVLLQGPRYKIKEITVNPGAALSLQSHNHRSEHWVVIEGLAKVTLEDKVEFLQENQSTYIPVRSKHRLQNPGIIPLKIVEVQNGSYIGEDDIIRYEDIYGRTNDQNKIK